MSHRPLNRIPTVAVLGASYGGRRPSRVLARDLPEGWRVVLIERNSHFNHLYALPRYAVLPGHEHKAFVPYTYVFMPLPADDTTFPIPSPMPPMPPKSRALHLRATVTSLSSHSLTLDKAFPEHGISESDRTLHFDYLVYALGSHLPAPINLWGPVAGEDVENADVLDVTRGTKEGGVEWLKEFQKRTERASSVLVVGGGALGIQLASDIADCHPTKKVTLLHSRQRLLPRFDEAMHTEIISSLSALNVCTILGDRLDLSTLDQKKSPSAERVVRTVSGREITADLILLCTGQVPNTGFLQEVFPQSVIPDGPNKGMARVRRTLQLAEPVPASELPDAVARLSLSEAPLPDGVPEEDPATRVAAEHIFVIGDAADAFGAINAGHNAFYQGELAAYNIVKLVKRKARETDSPQSEQDHTPTDEDLTLGKYIPRAPAIKVSVGLTKRVYQSNGVIGRRDNQPVDLSAHLMWQTYGFNYTREDIEHDRPEWGTVPE